MDDDKYDIRALTGFVVSAVAEIALELEVIAAHLRDEEPRNDESVMRAVARLERALVQADRLAPNSNVMRLVRDYADQWCERQLH